MGELTPSLDKIALIALASRLCPCGNVKQFKGKSERSEDHVSFCRQCYYSLPDRLRRDLYKPFREGYTEAVSAAWDYLQIEKQRIKLTMSQWHEHVRKGINQ